MALIGAQFVQAVQPVPVGSLQAFAGANAPTGWLLCDGTSYSTSVYPDLFSVLAYTYGGSSGNFNVPDLRGRMPIGAGNENVTGNNTLRTVGVKGGDTRMPSHNHDIQRSNVAASSTGTDTSTVYRTLAGTGATYTTTQSAGSGGGDNMPPFLVTNYIIKALPDVPRQGVALGNTPPIVTTLPANPQFGEVVTYAADATNGVYWDLQYDATGTYPWKFIGGAPWMENAAGGTLAGATPSYSLLTGYTVALPGDYMVTIEVGFALATTASATYVEMGPVLNSEAFDYPKVSSFYCAAANIGGPMVKTRRITVASSGGILRGIFQPNPAQGGFNRITETVTPVRVKAA